MRQQSELSLRWAVVGGRKCVGKYLRQANGTLLIVFIVPKHYCNQELQAEMTEKGYPYVQFVANSHDDKIVWGNELSPDMFDAFLYRGLPHESEWVK